MEQKRKTAGGKIKAALVGLFAAVIAVCSMVSLTGCGSTTDWSKATWEDYDPEVFLFKEDVAWGLGIYDETSSVDQYAAWNPTYLMLYEDGSAAAATSIDWRAMFSGVGLIYDDYYIWGISYGYWTQDGDSIYLYLKGLFLADCYENGELKEGVSLDDYFYEFEYETEIVDGVITIASFKTIGSNGLVSHPVQSQTPAEFTKLADWYTTYTFE